MNTNMTKDFALIADDGRVLHPYQSRNKNTGRFGYACMTPEHGRVRDNGGTGGYYTEDLVEVIQGVILKGWGVRARMDGTVLPKGTKNPGNTFQFGKDNVHQYWVAPKYRGLVIEALQPPLAQFPKSSKKHVWESWPYSFSAQTAFLDSETDRVSHDAVDLVLGRRDAEEEIDADPRCQNLSLTEREVLVNARIGQGVYREGMLAIWGRRCALTGLAVEAALVASHAKPWKTSENAERTDPYNGLLLAATIDRLFDRGLISFADDGTMLVGPDVTSSDLALIGVSPGAKLSNRLEAQHLPFLRVHRELFGFKG